MQEETSKELWELVGDRWTLPIHVHFEEGFAIVTLVAIPLLESQRRAACELLEPLRSNSGAWVATPEVLSHFARKSKFTNPEDVVEWRRAVTPAFHSKDPRVDEFLDSFVANGSCPSRATMSALYAMLCAHMLQWLLRGKPLPLYFATIYPLLFRKDWKERLHYEEARRKKAKMDSDSLLAGSRLESLGEVEDKHGQRHGSVVATWSLNLVHEKMFEHCSTLAEHKIRVSKKGDEDKYWEKVRGRAKRQHEYAKLCYEDYRKAASQQSPSATRGLRKSTKGIPGKRRKQFVDGKLYSLKHLPFWRGKRAESGRCGAVARKNPSVQEVPGLQPKPEDVRDTRQDVQG
jgi:hypothetical protein